MIYTARSHAKVNLFLNIVGKNSKGYHNLQSYFVLLNLSDLITVNLSSKSVFFSNSKPLLLVFAPPAPVPLFFIVFSLSVFDLSNFNSSKIDDKLSIGSILFEDLFSLFITYKYRVLKNISLYFNF